MFEVTIVVGWQLIYLFQHLYLCGLWVASHTVHLVGVKNLVPTEIRSMDCPAHSKSLYHLGNPSPLYVM